MLVLARKKNQSIIIGDDIEILIVDVNSDNQVKLGIKAPRSISVHRKEVYENLTKEMQQAAVSNIENIDIVNITKKTKESISKNHNKDIK